MSALKDTMGLEAVCPLTERLYGGMPTSGGFHSYTEYEIGAQRIAEACHCILGSLGNLGHPAGGRGEPWSTWRDELPYEEDHLNEEVEIVTRCLKEYSRPIYDSRVNDPTERYRPWVDKTIHSMRTQGPLLAVLARRRRQELSVCSNVPEAVLQTAHASYTVLATLGDVCHEAVSGHPSRRLLNPYRDILLGAAVWKLEKMTAALLQSDRRPVEPRGCRTDGRGCRESPPPVVEEAMARLEELGEPYWIPSLQGALPRGSEVRKRQDFYDVELEDGVYLIRAEAWGEGCLSEGVGPWSSVRHGDDADWPSEDLEERLEEYRDEARLRREDPDTRPGDPDAPPEGRVLVTERWVRIPCTRHGHDTLQLALWETA